MEHIAEAVAGSYKLPWDRRTLVHVAPFLGMGGPGRLANRLAYWHTDGVKQNLFGASKDELSFNRRIAGFEMGNIVKESEALPSVLMYLFHRIASVLDGTPTVIVLEEGWALLKHPIFADKIEEWLKTLRKLNALVIFTTQNVEDAIRSPISPSLVALTSTHIYFPNPKATEEFRSVFRLSEKELSLLRDSIDPQSRFFLLKQGRDSVVARVDLSGMPDALAVLSGRVETVAHLTRLRAEVGDDPDLWMPRLLEKSHEPS